MNQQFPILWYYYVVHTSNFPSHLASKLRDAGKRSLGRPEALLYFRNANLDSFKILVLFVLICIEITTILKESRFPQLSS